MIILECAKRLACSSAGSESRPERKQGSIEAEIATGLPPTDPCTPELRPVPRPSDCHLERSERARLRARSRSRKTCCLPAPPTTPLRAEISGQLSESRSLDFTGSLACDPAPLGMTRRTVDDSARQRIPSGPQSAAMPDLCSAGIPSTTLRAGFAGCPEGILRGGRDARRAAAGKAALRDASRNGRSFKLTHNPSQGSLPAHRPLI